MSMIFFLLFIVFFILTVYPYTIYPATLLVLKKIKVQRIAIKDNILQQTYAVCMCAYNEEAVIVQKAENLRALQNKNPGLEVRIYVDSASDRTAELLKPYENDFFIHVSNERHGKTYGMNMLVAGAKSSIILFTDANVMLEESVIQKLAPYFSDEKIGCVCGHLIYTNPQSGSTAATGSLYWKLEEFIKQAESDTGSVMGADGSIFAIRKSLHTPPPADIIDDMFVSFSILCDGFRVVRAPDVVAYEESVTSGNEEFRRKVRIACQAFNVHRLIWPRLKKLDGVNLYKYISHKLIRWFTLAWMTLGGFSLLMFMVSTGQALLAVLIFAAGSLALYGGYKMKISPFPQVVDILASFVGTTLGVWKSIHGERFQTWVPAQSIRKTT